MQLLNMLFEIFVPQTNNSDKCLKCFSNVQEASQVQHFGVPLPSGMQMSPANDFYTGHAIYRDSSVERTSGSIICIYTLPNIRRHRKTIPRIFKAADNLGVMLIELTLISLRAGSGNMMLPDIDVNKQWIQMSSAPLFFSSTTRVLQLLLISVLVYHQTQQSMHCKKVPHHIFFPRMDTRLKLAPACNIWITGLEEMEVQRLRGATTLSQYE